MSLSVNFVLAFIGFGLVSGCIWPRTQFVDRMEHSFYDDYRAYADGQKLIIEVKEAPGHNLAEFKQNFEDGSLYLSGLFISSGGAGTRRFEIDISNYQFEGDWRKHLYWLVRGPLGYPIGNPGFWSPASREPRVRKQIELTSPPNS